MQAFMTMKTKKAAEKEKRDMYVANLDVQLADYER